MSQGRHLEPGDGLLLLWTDHPRDPAAGPFDGMRSACESRIRESRAHSARRPCCACCPPPIRARTRRSTRCSTPCTPATSASASCPIENSIGGSIHRNYDLLVERELSIVGEVQVPVVHQLLALPGVRLEEVRRVLSHPQALAQCARFLRGLDGVEAIATYDTAGSAKMVRDEQRRDTAAIASARAGELFGLEALRAGIQDFDDNITRFLAISRQRTPLAAPDKTSVVFTLRNEPGALFKALSVFALRGIDLSKLESQARRGPPVRVPVLRRRGRRPGGSRSARAPCSTSLSSPRRCARSGSYPRWRRTEPGGEDAGADRGAGARGRRAGCARRRQRRRTAGSAGGRASWLTTPSGR